MLKATGAEIQKHKHCKPNCTTHNSFASSLRKYATASRTKSTQNRYGKDVQQSRDKDRDKENLNRKKSVSYIKPFVEARERDTASRRLPHNSDVFVNKVQTEPVSDKQAAQEIQSLIVQVSLAGKGSKQSKEEKGNEIKWGKKEEVLSKREAEEAGERLAKVRSKDFQELQFNVERISKIINAFNNKINCIESSNSLLRQETKPEITSQFLTGQSPHKEPSFAQSHHHQTQSELSPILKKIQIKEIQKQKQNSSHFQSKMESVEQRDGASRQFTQQKLNYKMFNNWTTKSGSAGSSVKQSRNRCHGHNL